MLEFEGIPKMKHGLTDPGHDIENKCKKTLNGRKGRLAGKLGNNGSFYRIYPKLGLEETSNPEIPSGDQGGKKSPTKSLLSLAKAPGKGHPTRQKAFLQ